MIVKWMIRVNGSLENWTGNRETSLLIAEWLHAETIKKHLRDADGFWKPRRKPCGQRKLYAGSEAVSITFAVNSRGKFGVIR